MRILLSFSMMLTCVVIFAQAPINDECENAIHLGTTPLCDTTQLFTNRGATPSDSTNSNIPPCFKGGVADFDVWFTFTTTDALEYIFTIQGKPDSALNDSFGLFNPEVALYAGDCDTSNLQLLQYCESAPNQVSGLTFSATDLLPNTTYIMRVNASIDSINTGAFWLCIEEFDDMFRVSEMGSTLCNGKVYDTGGPDSTYFNNEDYIFTICPEETHACLTLDFGNYEMESKGQGGDYFKIFDGPDTNGILIGASFDMRDTTDKNQVYGINNAVCQSYSASSGCITILWHTDSSEVAEGFNATWSCSMDSCTQYDSLRVAVGPDGSSIVDHIQGRLIDIEVAGVNCIDSAFATFTGDNTDLGMSKGLLLTTGRADLVGRPNSLPDMGFKNDTTGIDLLDSLSLNVYEDTTLTHDGCSVALDFVPETDIIALELILGSEEYPECIDEQMTDLMGLFYRTAGFAGDPRLNNYRNLALLPNDSVDIQISTVNPNDSARWMYYRNMLNSQSIEYDGTVINGPTATKFILLTQNSEPCQTNELIAAIADRGDSLYDSGIFISNIRCLTPTMSFSTSTGLPFLIETCNPGEDRVTFNFPRTYEDDTEWTVEFEGSAQVGSDVIWEHGDKITLPAGAQSVSYEIDVVDDGKDEGSEWLKIKLKRDWGCGEVELTEIEIEIRDKLIVDIETIGQPCKGEPFEINATGDLEYLTYEWEPAHLFQDPTWRFHTIIPEEDTRIILTGTIIGTAGCQWRDTFDMVVIAPEVSIAALDPTGICVGESVQLEATDNVSGTGLRWTPNTWISDNRARRVTVTPQRSLRYYVEVDTVGCKATDSVDITVDMINFPNVISDTTICAGESIQLARLNGSPNNSTYTWMPPNELDNPTSPTPVANPSDTTTFSLFASSENGYCQDSAQVTVNVIDIGVDIVGAIDPTYICRGDTTSFTAQTWGVGEISWSPAAGIISGSSDNTVVINPTVTTTYTVTYSSDRCTPSDQVTVIVDQLPNGLTADPAQSPYCVGDSITISLDVQGITLRDSSFDWSPNSAILSGDGTSSISVVADRNRTYSVEVINGACEGEFSIDVEVVDLELDFDFDNVCTGDTANLIGIIIDDTISQQYTVLYNWQSSDPSVRILDPASGSTRARIDSGAQVTLTATVGSCSFEVTKDVERSWLGELELIAFPDSVSNCSEVSLTLEQVGGMATSDVMEGSVEWTFVSDSTGNVTSIDSDDFSATYSPNQSGKVFVRFTDTNGCMHEYSADVAVETPRFTIPNAFTPNQDGMNDKFMVNFETSVEYDVLSMTVFNRWGQQVFQANDNSGWDGKIDGGEDAVSEVYLYVIELADACGNIITDCQHCKGDVTLIR